MQDNFQTISEFIRRTDELAHRKGLNLSEIHGLLGISKAMVFAYRSGKNPITAKVWRKLRDAELAAGISPGIAESSTMLKEEPISEAAGEAYEKPREGVPLSMEERMDRVERALQGIAAALEKLVERG